MGKVVGLTFPKKVEEYVCPECGKVYKSQPTLEKHMQEKHSDTPPADPAAGSTSKQ